MLLPPVFRWRSKTAISVWYSACRLRGGGLITMLPQRSLSMRYGSVARCLSSQISAQFITYPYLASHAFASTLLVGVLSSHGDFSRFCVFLAFDLEACNLQANAKGERHIRMNWFKSFWRALTEPHSREAQLSMDSLDNDDRRRERAAVGASEVQFSMESFNNFTPRAQQVLALARKEADRFNHNFVGTEHVLLGLIALGQGTAVSVLRKLGLHLDAVRLEVEKQVGTGPDQKMIGNIPYTPRVKKVLALAAKEARALRHTYVGTEHILLGLLREGDGVAPRVLKNLGVNFEQTRREILRELDSNFRPTTRDDAAVPKGAESAEPGGQLVDTSKRYDVYCIAGDREIVYRNARFKGAKKLLPSTEDEALSEFIELEQVDGPIMFIARASIARFCEHVE